MVFSSSVVSVPVSAGSTDPLLYSTAKASECHSAALQPVFLCVGRTEVCISDAFYDHHGFLHRKRDRQSEKGRQSKKGEAFSYDFNPCGSFHPWIF